MSRKFGGDPTEWHTRTRQGSRQGSRQGLIALPAQRGPELTPNHVCRNAMASHSLQNVYCNRRYAARSIADHQNQSLARHRASPSSRRLSLGERGELGVSAEQQRPDGVEDSCLDEDRRVRPEAPPAEHRQQRHQQAPAARETRQLQWLQNGRVGSNAGSKRPVDAFATWGWLVQQEQDRGNTLGPNTAAQPARTRSECSVLQSGWCGTPGVPHAIADSVQGGGVRPANLDHVLVEAGLAAQPTHIVGVDAQSRHRG